MTKKITIRKGQLGLLAKNGDYYQVLEAGEHRLPWFNTPEVLVVNLETLVRHQAGHFRHAPSP